MRCTMMGRYGNLGRPQLVAGLEQADQLTCNDLAQKGMQHEEAAVQHLYGRV